MPFYTHRDVARQRSCPGLPSDALSARAHTGTGQPAPHTHASPHTPPHPPCQLPVCSINHCVMQIGRSACSSREEKSPTNVDFHGNQTQRRGRRNETCCLVFVSVTAVCTPPPILLVCALLDQSAFVSFFSWWGSRSSVYSVWKR